MKRKYFNIVALNDWHVGFSADKKKLYHDEKAIRSAFDFCRQIQPDIIIISEAHDFYAVSKFDKDPSRLNTLQDEINQVTFYFHLLRDLCPKSRIILINSNHLDRLRKYLWRQAPALASLNALRIEELLELKEHNIEFMDTFKFNGVLFKHGSLVRKDSGMTARAEFQKEGMSGVSGHTHRLGQFFKTLNGGKYMWIESGCLCNLDPEYADGTMDWQQGIALIQFKRADSDHYYPFLFPMIGHELKWWLK